jgi:methionine-rich copper-binding protein CopC
MYTKRSQIYGVWIAVAIIIIFVTGSITAFENFGTAYGTNDLSVSVSTEDDEVNRGDTQKVTVTVTEDDDSNNEISGADVKLTVYPPDSDSTKAKDETDEDGKATFDVKIADDAEYGTYEVKVRVSKDGFSTKTDETSFKVTGSGNNADDDDDDANDDYNSHDDKGRGSDGKGKGHGEDDNDESSEQVLSQGNACGNGILSTGILCQNVANQLQGDGNAINIIAIQNGGENDDDNGQIKNHLNSASSSSSIPVLQSNIKQPEADTIDSIVDQYEQDRIDRAMETRLNYLK